MTSLLPIFFTTLKVKSVGLLLVRHLYSSNPENACSFNFIGESLVVIYFSAFVVVLKGLGIVSFC